jgi:Flp pilus assembly protein TadB
MPERSEGMSKARAAARAERAAVAAARAEASRETREKAAAERARRERRALIWRKVRLWQHGPSFRKRRETWGALATMVLLAMLVVYIFTRSATAVLGTALVFVVGAPVLLLLFFDRSRK